MPIRRYGRDQTGLVTDSKQQIAKRFVPGNVASGTIVFPISFSAAPVVVATVEVPSFSMDRMLTTYNVTPTGFQWQVEDITGTNVPINAGSIHYIATEV